MNTKKSAVKKPKKTKLEEPSVPEQPLSEQPEAVEPKLSDIKLILDALTATVLDHTRQIAELQEALARKRKPVPNGKVQILDKQTGEIYRSKNNAYQTLLKSGALKELVDKGIFGDIPQKNTFGWYALVRELPDRFEEVKPPEDVQQ